MALPDLALDLWIQPSDFTGTQIREQHDMVVCEDRIEYSIPCGIEYPLKLTLTIIDQQAMIGRRKPDPLTIIDRHMRTPSIA